MCLLNAQKLGQRSPRVWNCSTIQRVSYALKRVNTSDRPLQDVRPVCSEASRDSMVFSAPEWKTRLGRRFLYPDQ
jgi:hypothetical protein